MEIESWNKRTTLIEAWMEQNAGHPLNAILTASMDMVTEDYSNEDRQKVYESIRALFGTVDDSPLKKGKMPTLPAEVIVSVDSAVSDITAVYAAIGDFNLIQQVFPRSTKLGQYPSIEAYAEHMGAKARNNLIKAFREDRWNGEYSTENGLTVTPAEPQTDGGDQ